MLWLAEHIGISPAEEVWTFGNDNQMYLVATLTCNVLQHTVPRSKARSQGRLCTVLVCRGHGALWAARGTLGCYEHSKGIWLVQPCKSMGAQHPRTCRHTSVVTPSSSEGIKYSKYLRYELQNLAILL
jgi:hypothetical protein